MAYFFDTSALVKRYHQENGTAVVDAAIESSEHSCLISDLGVIELYSAFAKKVRTGEVDEAAFHDPIRGLAKDIQENRVQVVTLGEVDKRVAIALLETHGITESLRTLDALQLAVLKGLSDVRIAEVYCADQQFVAILEQEGFSVVNPEDVEVQ
jgi:predicted nucleic acid-binding protein